MVRLITLKEENMFNKLIYRLLFVLSLLLFASTQQVLGADKDLQAIDSAALIVEKIDINTASSEQLAAIKGLGNKKAQAIVDYRQEHGNFINLEQLIHVKGIGQSTLNKIQPFVTL